MKKLLLALLFAVRRAAGVGPGQVQHRLVPLHGLGALGLLPAVGDPEKWATSTSIEIELTLVNDYVESINLYTSGQFHRLRMTNMDVLTIPAVGGVDCTALIVGDFSNGNDGIVMKKGKSREGAEGPHRHARRVLGVALPAGAGARDERHVRARDQDGQHERRRHRGHLHGRPQRRRGHLEPAAATGPQRERRDAGLRLVEDPGRDHRPHGRAHQRAGLAQEGAGRRLVRNRWASCRAATRRRQTRSPSWRSRPPRRVPEFKAQLATTAMFYKAADAAGVRHRAAI